MYVPPSYGPNEWQDGETGGLRKLEWKGMGPRQKQRVLSLLPEYQTIKTC